MSTNNSLIVLHVAFVTNDFASGVSTVVPQYLNAQANHKDTKVALLNLAPDKLKGVRFEVFSQTALNELPSPFCNPSIVVFHEVYRSKYPALAASLTKLSIPYIITPHGSLTAIAQQHNKLEKALLNKLIFNRFIRNAKCVHFLSEKEMANSRAFRCKQALIIPNGINIPKVKLKPKKQPIASFIGRLDIEVKGLDLLVKCIPLIANELRAIGACINIYGPERNGSFETLSQLITENHVSDLIFIKGPVTGRAKTQALLESQFYIQLSRTEGFPTSVLEALAHGLPIVVTEGTAWKDTANVKGIGIGTESNLEDIAHAIITLFKDDDLRNRMSAAALNYVACNYQWEQISEQQLSLYKKIAQMTSH